MTHMEGKDIIMNTHFLSSCKFYRLINESDRVWIEHSENYQKRSLRNKCDLLSANGKLSFTIPLEKGKNASKPIKEVRVSYDEDWVRQFKRTLKSTYGNAPFFDYIYDDVSLILDKNIEFLHELNSTLLEWSLDFIGIDKSKICYTEEYQKVAPEGTADYRNMNTIKMKQSPYPQVFEHKFGFVDDMSVLDLLFCCGPEAIIYL